MKRTTFSWYLWTSCEHLYFHQRSPCFSLGSVILLTICLKHEPGTDSARYSTLFTWVLHRYSIELRLRLWQKMSEREIVSVQSEPFLKLVYYEGFVLLHTYFRFFFSRELRRQESRPLVKCSVQSLLQRNSKIEFEKRSSATGAAPTLSSDLTLGILKDVIHIWPLVSSWCLTKLFLSSDWCEKI